MKIDYKTLTNIAYEAELDDDNIRTDYSGRGMYGKSCVGFDFDRSSQLLRLGAALQSEDLLETFAGRASFDSMGRGTIVYFPGIECTDAPDSENDDEDDE